MARRDVDLVIRARDEARGVLDQITKALEDFQNAQRGVDSSAEKTESSLGQLGAAIASLKKDLGGLEVADKLAGELRKAEKELSRLEAGMEGTQAEAVQMEKRLAATGDQADRFARKLGGATDALARQKSAVARAKADQKELSAAYASAERSQEKLAARQAKLPQLIEKQTAALDKAKARYAELADQIERTVEPSRTLQGQFDAAARNVDKQTTKLTKLATEYQEIGGTLRAAGSAMAIFGQQSDKATSNVDKQVRTLGKIDDNLKALRGQSKAASGEQEKLAGSFDKITSSLSRQQGTLEKAEENYVELAVAAGQADAAMERFSAASLGRLEGELKSQKKAALEAKREYLELTQTAGELAARLNATTNPSRQLREEFERTKVSAGAAKQEYLEQRNALHRMTQAYQQTGTTLASITGTQERFVQIQDRTSTALEKVEKSAKDANDDLDRLYGTTTRTASGMTRLEGTTRRTASALDKGAQSTSRLAAAYRQFYGDSRRSLSLLQRIRGEVLSLVAAYGGLYAVIEVLRGTVDAYQSLEAAQARINVSTGGDAALAAQELDFLRRSADRLGVQFGVLSTEYSKFAIATQGTRLEGQATRDIFTAVAEAARVNRSSTREMSGVFVALTQIVSKGAVQMEELRQQLGDRLPGAVRIMADALGVTTAELTKMLEQGEVTSDALIPFAEELRKRFGSGLPEALESTSTAIGRLANEAFEALLRFGNAGFIESFTRFVNDLTEVLQSAAFIDFSARASVALGGLIDLLGFAAQNFNILVAALAGFIGLKLTPIVLAMVAALRGFGTAATGASVGVGALQARAAAMGVTVSRTTLVIRNLRRALLLLMGTTGIGLLVAAIGTGIALWATSATDATEALVEHERIVDAVKNAYDEVGGSVENWAKALKDVTLTDARRSLGDLKTALLDATRAFDEANSNAGSTFATRFFGVNLVEVSEDYQNAIDGVLKKLKSGEIGYDGLVKAIDEVNEEFRDGSDINERYAEALVDAAKKVERQFEAWEEANLVVKALTGSTEEQQAALEELNGVVKKSAAQQKTAAEKSAEFEAALVGIKEQIPEIKREMEYLDASKALENQLRQALLLAQNWEDVAKAIRLAGQAQSELDRNFNARSAGQFEADFVAMRAAGAGSQQEELVRAVTALASQMGLAAEDLLTVISYETGGSLSPSQLGPTTQHGQHFGLIQFGQPQGRRYGVTPESSVTDQVIAAGRYLEDAGVKAGDGLLQIYAAINAGDPSKIYASDENNGGAPGTVLDKVNDQMDGHRSRAQGLLAAYAGVAQEAEKTAEADAKATEEAAKQSEATAGRIADNEFEIEQAQRLAAGKERQAAIEATIRDAKADNPNITQEEIDKITEQTGRLFDLEQARKNARTESEKARDAEAEVNNLLAQRQALQEQFEQAQAQGNTEVAGEIQNQIAGINAELTAAIDNAIRMWEAVGGSAAEAAIAKLQVARNEAANFGQDASRTYLQWNRVGDLFVNGLTNAFQSFAKAVAEGQSAGEAARNAFLQFASDFLLQIAQMIIQQAIFNALRAAFGGTPFGALIGVGAGHTGGLVGGSRIGSANRTREVNPAVFAFARRFHGGGLPGLAPNEVPAILKKGEEVLAENDPRHMLNGGGMGGSKGGERPLTIVNTLDPVEVLERALSTPAGEEVFLNTMQTRRTEVKAAIG